MNDDVIRNICKDISVPKMIKVRQHFVEDNISPQDIPDVVQECLKRDAISSQIKPGMAIAITCGSRGVANINIIIKAVVDYVKKLGANPFIFPAMGSHGGATAEGQLQIVNGYGVTEEAMGCPIKASMETKQIATTDDGRPVFIDKYASEADGIILVGRIKAHTQFVGTYESGLMKMAVIGMGKQHGAESVHAQGFKNMAKNIRRYGKAILKNAPVICGIGTIENAYDQTYKLAALTPEEIIQQEPDLLKEAKKIMGHILIDDADVLIVDQIGKNISGDGMDPNVSGTLPRETGVPRGEDGSDPKISNFHANRVIVLDLTEETHGNGNGLGLADITTKRCVDKVIDEMAYPNAITATLIEMVKQPLCVSNDKLAIQVAIKTCVGADKQAPRIIRIKNTMEIQEIEVSEALLPEVQANENLEIIGELAPMSLDDKGNLF